ncbi:STAS domain-containing protein [Streptomyces sp. SP18BB07]|uniref:STAS domain-containing protein n=1 Tax=Streptomyces sp. SP18BB07 TaxID=3002522 RepID=UPI002E78908C|nr:STAS domain-containing protein [Streptomyces sp. SP18BB07]MEE1760515.1 STAS domain-containing protein [Streptomyces sp. SP18BB07]
MSPDAHDRAAPRPGGTAPESGSVVANPYARTRQVGPFVVIEVSGEIDMASAGSLAEHLTAAATGAAPPDVLVDLRHVAFFDCSGLRVLCRAEATARSRGGRLRLVSDQPRIHRLLRAAGLLGRFPPLPDVPSASSPPPPPPQRPSLK